MAFTTCRSTNGPFLFFSCRPSLTAPNLNQANGRVWTSRLKTEKGPMAKEKLGQSQGRSVDECAQSKKPICMILANMMSASHAATTIERIRLCSSVPQHLKRLKMDQPNIFREFSEKIQTILASPDPQVVLEALRALAEGRAAKLQDGTEIEALSGLQNQAQEQDPTELYRQTIAALLHWAVKTFPNQSRWGVKTPLSESAKEPNLWETIALLDGPKGYNQRLIGDDGLYIDGVYMERCEPPEAGLCIPVVPLPTVLEPSQRQPVQPLDEDLPYIPEFLRGKSTARAVVATRCKFGWERLSVDCLCLYVDAHDTTALENSITSLKELIMIKKAKLCHTVHSHAVDSVAEAQKLLRPTSFNNVELAGRWYDLRKNPIPRVVKQHGHIYHGQSISLIGEESKGSVGVFLSPRGVEETKLYALTAYHVVPFKTNQQRVITPGGLDLMSQLQAAVTSHVPPYEDIEVLLKRLNEACGYTEYGHIGVNQEGWRSDFALIRLDNHWRGENGQWYHDDELTGLHSKTEKFYFPGTRGIVGRIDPQTGDIVYKDGAATGCAAGMIGLSEAVLFKPRTANIATDETAPDVVRAKLLMLQSLGDEDVCAAGDSGSSVFVPVPEEDGWKWAGQLVSRLIMNGSTLGLMIPQSQVLQGLEENTGMVWRMTGLI